MQQTANFILLLLAGMVFAGCAPQATQVGEYAQQIRALETAHPSKDVEAAVAAGDYRFVGVMGIGLIVPGVPDSAKTQWSVNDVRVIPNTGDLLESPEQVRLQAVATDYCIQYNRFLSKKLPRP